MHPMQLPPLLLLRCGQLAACPLHCQRLAFQPAHRHHQLAAHQLLPFDWRAHGPLAMQIAVCAVEMLPAMLHRNVTPQCYTAMLHRNHTLQAESQQNPHGQYWHCI